MKMMILTLLTISSLSLMAKSVTVNLTSTETQLALYLVNKYKVPLQLSGVCTKTEFDVVDIVKGFNPASWSLEFKNETFQLEGDEVIELINLHNRLEIPSKRISGITLKTRITITGASCGFSPNKWTITYDDQN